MRIVPRLDWTTCTMRDVCAHSARVHPSLYREALLDAAGIHGKYASRPDVPPTVAEIAFGMVRDLRAVAGRIDSGDMSGLTLAEAIHGFAVAARLQGIPPSLRVDIAARD